MGGVTLRDKLHGRCYTARQVAWEVLHCETSCMGGVTLPNAEKVQKIVATISAKIRFNQVLCSSSIFCNARGNKIARQLAVLVQ